MVEAEGGLRAGIECGPVGSRRLQQREGAFDVRLDEGTRAVDASVDVALGGEVQHGARAVLGQQAVDERAITDVAVHEDMPCVALQRGQVAQVAGVGEGVEIDDGLVALRQPVEDEVAADEAGASGHEEGHFGALP
jgi:hypothetical protein